MLYSLPNGKVIEISLEQYLELSDDDLNFLISINYGEEVNNPWFGSILDKPDRAADDSSDYLGDLDVPYMDE